MITRPCKQAFSINYNVLMVAVIYYEGWSAKVFSFGVGKLKLDIETIRDAIIQNDTKTQKQF